MSGAENNWQIGVHAYAEAAPGKTVSLLTWHYYKHGGLFEAYTLDPDKLYRFAPRIEAGYSAPDLYHNRQRAYALNVLK